MQIKKNFIHSFHSKPAKNKEKNICLSSAYLPRIHYCRKKCRQYLHNPEKSSNFAGRIKYPKNMKVINLSEHPSLLNQYLKELRSITIQKDSMRFRKNIERIGQIMAFEVSKELTYAPEEVTTPLAVAKMEIIQDPIVLGTILRAGLPLHQGFLDMFDHAENAFVSAYRKEMENEEGQVQLEIVSEYLAAPALENKTLLLIDPMLATGMSMEIAYKALLSHGTPASTHLVCVFATPQAIKHLEETMPKDTTVWCAVIDPELNAKKYIVPGLGDAGDLCFGQKL